MHQRLPHCVVVLGVPADGSLPCLAAAAVDSRPLLRCFLAVLACLPLVLLVAVLQSLSPVVCSAAPGLCMRWHAMHARAPREGLDCSPGMSRLGSTMLLLCPFCPIALLYARTASVARSLN